MGPSSVPTGMNSSTGPWATTSPVTTLRPYNWAVESRIRPVLDLIWAEPIEATGLFSVGMRQPKTRNPNWKQVVTHFVTQEMVTFISV